MSLIQTWIKAGKDDGLKTEQAILDEMNRELGLNIKHNRVWEWRNGVQRPPVEATNYMLRVSILYALQQLRPRFKLTSGEQCLLMDMLSIPKKERKND